MRRLAILLAVACLLSACAGQQKTRRIDLIVKGTETEFWKSVNEGAQAAASTFGVEVRMHGPAVEEEPAKQIAYMDEAIARTPDAVILAAADYSQLVPSVERATQAGIPVVMVDSDVNSGQTAAYVGTDNRALGRRLAQELCGRVSEDGSVALMSFVRESYPAVEREAGFREEMEGQTRFTLLETAYCNSDIALAEKQMTRLLINAPDLTAVAALNAQTATGAARALSRAGRQDIKLFAVDCTVEEAMFMDEGKLELALLQNPYQMGYYSVQTACAYLDGAPVTNVYTDIFAVDRQNLFSEMYQQLIFPFA